jgi:hypothetical protein
MSDDATVEVAEAQVVVASPKEDEKGLSGGKLAAKMLQMADEDVTYAGLELIKELDGLYIQQEWEIFEQVVSWYEQKNEYTVFDKNHKTKLFKAQEETSCCFRLCCGENRPFTIHLNDTTGEKDKKALVFNRKYRCCGWAVIPCCAHRVDVHYMVDANGNTIGSTSDRTKVSSVDVPLCGGCCQPTWHIRNKKGETQASINGGTCCVCDFCGKDFTITDASGAKIGSLKKLSPKNFKQAAMEMVSEADNFRVEFPKSLDPGIKLALMAATLQIDFTFFEDDRGPCQGRCCDIWCCGWACPCVPAWCLCLPCFACCCSDEKKKGKDKNKKKGAPETVEMVR